MGSLTELALELEADEHQSMMEGQKEYAGPQEVPEYVPASADRIREALQGGGRAVVSVRSRKSGKHVTVVLYCRKQKEGEQGYVSRATVAGRVGMADAYCVEARAEDMEYPDNYVGRLYLPDGPRWRAGKQADALRAWTAEKVLSFALGGYPLDHQADVFISTSCSFCGKRLTDPVSVERGVGPECYGRATGSKVAH